ncbi:zinc-binding alcohol dehydrogenase [Methylomonas sp. AM2-LC]|uniref:zinc-dependent alcohol dehydrogenase n=1 Tax=Methylomonas sp. AM2-LC TaxID=3153301 RepID=UPI003267DA05
MKAQQLWFTNPYQIEIREQSLPTLQAEQILIKNDCSAISAGTEMLVYRGQLPADLTLDATLSALQNAPTYPLQYGYASVGRVAQTGTAVASHWQDKRVFAFQPHASHFITTPEQVIALPDDMTPEAAVFLANMETAVNLLLDGNPALGERVLILGQGVVGLLVSSLLAQFPLAALYGMDGLVERRSRALRMGVQQVYDPGSATQIAVLKQALQLPSPQLATPGTGVDLIYELSGVPDALNLAIDLCGYSGRIVIGSWYGNKAGTLHLGGVAHRNRIKLISSQVSSIAPELTGRWDKARRFHTSWDMLRRVQPQSLISHRLPLTQANSIYQQLDQTPEKVLQAIFIY